MSWLYIPESIKKNLSMSPCSAAGGANSLAANGSKDGVPSAMLNTIAQQQTTLSDELETDFWTMLLSGMMSELLTAVRGRGKSMSLREVFRANRSPWRADNLALPTLETCGLTPSASFVKYNPDTSSWKTCRGFSPDAKSASKLNGLSVHSLGRFGVAKKNLSSSLPTSDEFSQTWPKAGLMLAGACYRLPKWEQRISEIASGLWPTVKSSEADKDSRTSAGAINEVARGRGPSLSAVVVAMFPTPVVPNGGRKQKLSRLTLDGRTLRREDGSKAQMDLQTFVRMWATPRANENGDYQYDKGDKTKPRPTLSGAVKQFPTPRNSDGMKGKLGDGTRKPNGRLEDVIAQENSRWATPSARDWRTGLASTETMSRNSRPLSEQVVTGLWRPPQASDGDKWNAKTVQERLDKGHSIRLGNQVGVGCGNYLNPDWVEWLMGWPIGWTDETCSEENFLWWLMATIEGVWWHYEPEAIPRTVGKGDNRIERIRMLGNGQVPLQAAVAPHLLVEF